MKRQKAPSEKFMAIVGEAVRKVLVWSAHDGYVASLRQNASQVKKDVSMKIFWRIYEKYSLAENERSMKLVSAEQEMMVREAWSYVSSSERRSYAKTVKELELVGIYADADRLETSYLQVLTLPEHQRFEVLRVVDLRCQTGVFEENRALLFRMQADQADYHFLSQRLQKFTPSEMALQKAMRFKGQKNQMQGFLKNKYGGQKPVKKLS